MANKNRRVKKSETAPILSAEGNAEITGSTQAGAPNATTFVDPDLQAGEQSSSDADALTSFQLPEEQSPEDLLDDVRRSLITEEADKSQKDSKWWNRFGRREGSPEPEKTPVIDEIDLPMALALVDMEEEQAQSEDPDETASELDDLIDMLVDGTEEDAVASTTHMDVEAPPLPEPVIDVGKLKEQAFRPRPPEAEAISEVRTIALEGDDEVFVEVQAPVSDPLEERFSAFENALKPYQQYINIALALFGVGVIVIVSLMIFNIYQRTQPQMVEEPATVPYPTSVALPGGWSFKLGKGTLEDGNWEPRGAEWLQGTEISRWVALPWSRQLEAVVRTLNPQDPITLTMSNNDRLVYKVYSIRQLKPEQLLELDPNSPSLLVILTKAGSEERWVLTALP